MDYLWMDIGAQLETLVITRVPGPVASYWCVIPGSFDD